MTQIFTIGQTALASAVKPVEYQVMKSIRWVELYRDADRMLLVSEEILDWDCYVNVDRYLELNSEDCPLMFTEEEREIILEICILSAEEVEKYMPAHLLVAEINMVEVVECMFGERLEGSNHVMSWWLRTLVEAPGKMCVVDAVGQVDYEGIDILADEVGIRPAMWVRLGQLEGPQMLKKCDLLRYEG